MARRPTQTSFVQAFQSLKGEIKANYSAARSSRFRRRRNVPLQGAGADYHLSSEGDWLQVLEYARDMDRNDAVVGQIVDRAVANEIQDGIQLDPETGSEELDRELAARWEAWAGNPDECDAAGELTFHQMERLVSRQVKIDGDMMALPLESGALQLVEAHRCRTPKNTKRNVVHGVLLDPQRRRLEYWFTKDELDPSKQVQRVSEMAQYPVRDDDGNRMLFHVLNPKRVSQTRGVTALAPIFDLQGMFEDTNFAKLVAQQVLSCFVIFRMREDLGSLGGPPPLGASEETTHSDGSVKVIENLSPGLEITGAPGEKFDGFSPQIPNPEFFDHMKFILTLIGVNLGLPLVMVLLDAKETNFSGWRGAVDQARMGFRDNQANLIARFHRPVYRWKVRQWLSEQPEWERLAGVRDVFGHRWNPPSWPYIEPYKDAQADALRLDKNLTSPRRLQAERGREWKAVARELVEDRALLIRGALEQATGLEGEFPGCGVTWRDLAGVAGATQGTGDREQGTEDEDRGGRDEEEGRDGQG